MAKESKNFDIRKYSEMRCPMDGLLNLISGPWTTYILWLIRNGQEMRFGEIKKQLPLISSKVLTERLRMLEGAGILERRQEASIPPKVSYRFTKRGHDLEELLDQINGLALHWSGSKKKPLEKCALDKKLK